MADVGTPHHLGAECGIETATLACDDFDGVGRFADVQVDVVGVSLAASVKRDQKTAASAFYTEVNRGTATG